MAIRLDSRWDLLVENSDGRIILAVEVKRKNNVSPEWAAQFRHNILARGIFYPKTPYFLMAFPEQFYLWTDAEAYEPNYTIDARPILQPYFERAGVTAERISGQSFVLIIASWLEEMIHAENWHENADVSQRALIESGLYTALAGGKFKYEAIA
ncbi:MAG: hypothetical protein SVX43_19360 [Cyanobacteriota bacterium]|nr:hypothetical protein [Cyanobacteriota bacterium]